MTVIKHLEINQISLAQSAGAVEYTNWLPPEGSDNLYECPIWH